ncbi:cyclodeaminase/cyclohydrolase family protein [Actinopolymorpha sp. B17G11]|uniref:cyclodeaminase/cyclohydrolase family protein n=1 Tax=Actinopolymorpha sp. B17G11 TaxID=3160861 RepID=UPI0032E40AE7
MTKPTHDETIGAWLDALGSAAPAPGGGAAAAMSTAMGAALVAMVANLTIGRQAYAEHHPHVTRVRDEADELRTRAVELVAQDAEAFDALMATFRLPKVTDADKAARATAIRAATVRATEVSIDIAAAAARVVGLAESLLGRSNPSVVSDIAVAAASAVAGLESAGVNADINLRSLRDVDVKTRLTAEVERHRLQVSAGRSVVDAVRKEIGA